MNEELQLLTGIMSYIAGTTVVLIGAVTKNNIVITLGVIIYVLLFCLASINLKKKNE